VSPRVAFRIVIIAAVLALIVLVYRKLLHVNPTTVALTFLLAILSVAAAWGLRYSLPMSVAAALCFNFFFLPPVGTFTIADTQNWVALLAFFISSVIASNLSERARRQAEEANLRRRDVERLNRLAGQLGQAPGDWSRGLGRLLGDREALTAALADQRRLPAIPPGMPIGGEGEDWPGL